MQNPYLADENFSHYTLKSAIMENRFGSEHMEPLVMEKMAIKTESGAEKDLFTYERT